MSSTRSKASKAATASKNITHTRNCDTKVFFLDGSLVSENCENVQIISLRNPCTETSSRYLYAKHLNRIFEILNFAEEPRSWFIDDMLCANGSIYLTTAMDPLFLAIYYLQLNASERCVPFDQAVTDDLFPNTHLLSELISDEQLSMVANQKGDKSLKAFQFDEAKTLKWLTIKCNKLSRELQTNNFHIGAKSAYFVKSEKFENPAVEKVESEILSYTFGMLSEYISKTLSEKLSTHLGLEKATPVVLKRKSMNDLEQKSVKRLKSEEDLTDIFEAKPIVVERKKSAKEKSLAKAASGTKSISSFFTKK